MHFFNDFVCTTINFLYVLIVKMKMFGNLKLCFLMFLSGCPKQTVKDATRRTRGEIGSSKLNRIMLISYSLQSGDRLLVLNVTEHKLGSKTIDHFNSKHFHGYNGNLKRVLAVIIIKKLIYNFCNAVKTTSDYHVPFPHLLILQMNQLLFSVLIKQLVHSHMLSTCGCY